MSGLDSLAGSILTPRAAAVKNLEVRVGGNAESSVHPSTQHSRWHATRHAFETLMVQGLGAHQLLLQPFTLLFHNPRSPTSHKNVFADFKCRTDRFRQESKRDEKARANLGEHARRSSRSWCLPKWRDGPFHMAQGYLETCAYWSLLLCFSPLATIKRLEQVCLSFSTYHVWS